MLWESPDKATALLITTVRVDGIDIDPVLGDTYENAWIMPMQRAILPEGMEFTRTPGQDAAATASFLCNDTVDLSDTSPYPQYRSYDVVTNGHYAIDDLSERIIRPTTQIDNGQGPITVLETQDYTQFARTLGLWTRNERGSVGAPAMASRAARTAKTLLASDLQSGFHTGRNDHGADNRY